MDLNLAHSVPKANHPKPVGFISITTGEAGGNSTNINPISLQMPNQQYKEPQQLNLPEIDKEILDFWQENDIFRKSIESRDADNTFVFYEGPPSQSIPFCR